jgi:hypothetical protein
MSLKTKNVKKKPVKKNLKKTKEKITGSHEGDQEFIPKKVRKKNLLKKNAISVLLKVNWKSNNS